MMSSRIFELLLALLLGYLISQYCSKKELSPSPRYTFFRIQKFCAIKTDQQTGRSWLITPKHQWEIESLQPKENLYAGLGTLVEEVPELPD